MEIVIKFIFGASVFAFVINFLAIIGYITVKIRDLIYTKYRINILGVLYCPSDGLYYADYMFTGLFVISVILFLIGLVYCTYQIGNYIYS